MLEQKFKEKANYIFEAKFKWLTHVPDKETFKTLWEDISGIYSGLVDNLWTLDSKLEENSSQLRKGMQQVDIWFEEPYNLMVEFDEKQHFNQFRLITLNESCLFNYEVYESLCKPIRPGTSSFHRLKSSDPFFPEMHDGDKQDNRDRQRAFRDYLKDKACEVFEINRTLRIPYTVTNNKIKNFNTADLESVREYIIENGFLDRIKTFK